MICHPSCAIRLHVCRLLLNPTCLGSPGIRAAGARLQAGLNAGPTATPSPRREVTPCPCPPGNLSELVGCVGLRKPAAGLYEIGVGFLELVYGVGDPLKTYGEMRQAWERRRRVGGHQAVWGAKIALKPGIWERWRPADFAFFWQFVQNRLV